MTDGRELPDRVQWHEGMLLAPQHFQQADQRTEGLIHYHLLGTIPFPWGIRRLRFDPSLLAGGTLRVTELEAILPDGLLLTDPADLEEELSVELTPFAEGRPQGTLTVHLAVPALRKAHSPAAGSLSRYRSVEGGPVTDENTQETSVRIPRLRPRATLVVGDSAPEKYTSFPLARIQFQEEAYSLTDFVPPTLALSPKSELGDQCAKVVGRLRESAAFLAEKIQAAGEAGGDAKVAEMQQRLEQLSAPLPLLEALLPHAPHPWSLYLAFCTAAGQLAGTQTGTVPPGFRPYDHRDIVGSFRPVLAFCGRMADGIQQGYRVTAFSLEDGAFRLMLQEEWIGRPLLVGVTGGSAMAESEVATWMAECRIGAVASISSIRERRIRGAARRPVDRDDDLGVYPGRGVQLFQIRPDPEFVRAGEPLEISHPAVGGERGHPTQIVLYAPATG